MNLNEKEGIRFVKDVLSSFDDSKMASDICLECSFLEVDEKGLIGTKPIVPGKVFNSMCSGEYNIFRAGVGTVIIALLDETERIDAKELVMQTGRQIIDLTRNYYFDYIKEKPKSGLYTLIKKTLDKMTTFGIIDKRGENYYLVPVDTPSFVSKFFGQAMTHPTGISSFYRMMVMSLIGIEGGIEASFVPERLKFRHNIPKIKRIHMDTVRMIHINGSGYILEDIGARLYRLYERLDHTPSKTPSVLQQHPDVLNTILRTPCISHNLIYELFGEDIAKRLYAETQELTPNVARSILVRRNDIYLTGSFVNILELRDCPPETNPCITLIREMYKQFSPQDCTKVAYYGREVVHELHQKSEYKPQNEVERRILLFLADRELVKREPFGDDTFFNRNPSMLKRLSITLKNLLESSRSFTDIE